MGLKRRTHKRRLRNEGRAWRMKFAREHNGAPAGRAAGRPSPHRPRAPCRASGWSLGAKPTPSKCPALLGAGCSFLLVLRIASCRRRRPPLGTFRHRRGTAATTTLLLESSGTAIGVGALELAVQVEHDVRRVAAAGAALELRQERRHLAEAHVGLFSRGRHTRRGDRDVLLGRNRLVLVQPDDSPSLVAVSYMCSIILQYAYLPFTFPVGICPLMHASLSGRGHAVTATFSHNTHSQHASHNTKSQRHAVIRPHVPFSGFQVHKHAHLYVCT